MQRAISAAGRGRNGRRLLVAWVGLGGWLLAGTAVAQPEIPTSPPEAPDGSELPLLGPPVGRSPVSLVRGVYFPPNPPPLGVVPVGSTPSWAIGAPASLADYVMDPFYAPLSRVQHRGEIRDPRLREMLEAYDRQRADLLRELRARLDAVVDLGPAERRRELDALAREQAEALANWEAQGDLLRRGLYDTASWLAGNPGAGWSTVREWRLGRGELDRPREENRWFEYQVVRAAPYYQEGLAPAQRRLLREIGLELEAALFSEGKAAAVPAGWFEFFAPELARVHLPEALPPGAGQLLATFREVRSGLKRELRDAVYAQDKTFLGSVREEAFRELAHVQEPRFAELDALAEEIRRELQGVPGIGGLSRPVPLPPALEAGIAEYRRTRDQLQRELARAVRAATLALPRLAAESSVAESRAWWEEHERVVAAARAEFESAHAERFRALAGQLAGVREQVIAFAGPEAVSGGGPQFDSFLDAFLLEHSRRGAINEYATAVFEPGLSPAQRRLLFNAAVVAMHLPRPGSEPLPTKLPETLLK